MRKQQKDTSNTKIFNPGDDVTHHNFVVEMAWELAELIVNPDDQQVMQVYMEGIATSWIAQINNNLSLSLPAASTKLEEIAREGIERVMRRIQRLVDAGIKTPGELNFYMTQAELRSVSTPDVIQGVQEGNAVLIAEVERISAAYFGLYIKLMRKHGGAMPKGFKPPADAPIELFSAIVAVEKLKRRGGKFKGVTDKGILIEK